MSILKEHFLLNPDVIFLNHGSFGATPREVFEAYQRWQTRLEEQPVQFIARELHGHLKHTREKLGKFLHAPAENVVFIPNATFGINILARSLKLGKDDEILTSDHEYGACDNAWSFICQKTGASYIHQPISLPAVSANEIVEQFWGGVTARTKVIYLSHITSATALCLPIEEICRRARQAGIITVIDGAHAPGQMHLNLEALAADFYVGNCHKWMLGAKGAGFLYARKELQHIVEPLVVSWGWGENTPYTTGSDFLDHLEWWGTIEPSAYLSVPTAIHFQQQHDWQSVRDLCHQILREALQRISNLTELPSVYPDDDGYFHQMAVAPLPPMLNLVEFQVHLYERYRIEVPCIQWHGRSFIRISVQGYNTREDIDALLSALEAMIPKYRSHS